MENIIKQKIKIKVFSELYNQAKTTTLAPRNDFSSYLPNSVPVGPEDVLLFLIVIRSESPDYLLQIS